MPQGPTGQPVEVRHLNEQERNLEDRMNYMNSRNPHVRRMARIEAKSGLEMSDFDAKIGEEKGYKTCPCGSRAWFKPTVGTWICSCGMMFRQGGWHKRGGNA